MRPTSRCRRPGLTVTTLARAGVALVVLLVGACGSDAPTTAASPGALPEDVRPALLDALIGPWRREPLTVDPRLVAEADRVCRTDPEFPAGVALVFIDARGDGKLMSSYAGPHATAECAYLEISPAGVVSGSLSGTSSGQVEPIRPGRLEAPTGFGSGGEDGVWQAISGRAGAGITRVVVEVEGIGPVTATLRDGWFGAWWPVGQPVRPAGAPGPHVPMLDYVVTGYDILGQRADTFASAP